jgi:hypothetical protein
MSSITRLENRVSVYPRREQRREEEQEFETKVPYVIEKEDIPLDPQEFYEDFGPLEHQRTGRRVKRLTDYQLEIWGCPAKTVLVAKSQKTGITTSELLHDFQEMITGGRGKDMLIVAQTALIARDHLYTLKRMLVDSDKYRKYLITKSKELYFAEEKTKIGTVYLKNADNPFRPMRVMALPFRLNAIWSWKQIYRIHTSDPAVAPILNDRPVYAALRSRLTNTDGRMMIEGPPVGPYGHFYELHEQFKHNENPRFQVFDVTIYQARDAGLVTDEQIIQYKEELGPLFPVTYEASFIEGVGNVFDPRFINMALELGEKYKDRPISPYLTHLGGFDPGFGKESVAYITEYMKDERILRVIKMKTWDKDATPSQIAKDLHDLYIEIPNLWWILDGSNRGFVNECKAYFRENQDWEPKKPDEVRPDDNHVLPRNFTGNAKKWLFKLYLLTTKNKFAIPKEFKRLDKAMRTCRAEVVPEGFDMDKDKTLHDDDLDTIRLMMSHVT